MVVQAELEGPVTADRDDWALSCVGPDLENSVLVVPRCGVIGLKGLVSQFYLDLGVQGAQLYLFLGLEGDVAPNSVLRGSGILEQRAKRGDRLSDASPQAAQRYFAVVRPLCSRLPRWLALATVCGVWTASALLSLPNLLYSRTRSYRYADRSLRTVCLLIWPDGPAYVSRTDYVGTALTETSAAIPTSSINTLRKPLHRNPLRRGTARLTNWPNFRKDSTPLPPIDPKQADWAQALEQRVCAHTQSIALTDATPAADPHLLNVWDARQSLCKRWKLHRYNHSLRKRIARLNQEVQTYSGPHYNQNWRDFFTRVRGTLDTHKTSHLLRSTPLLDNHSTQRHSAHCIYLHAT
ncbi:hypothetical protein HPB48_018712 [Haemaphysalis longicornis]|uniref:Uncharacterized protein n=1 Tax=Haemaphysalis longicornis TaxID=44386 RepID=A0A9J6G1Y9_HAELO|nr:hypothetical protein HPB48_018712 [Haemaphysalis longicornis]